MSAPVFSTKSIHGHKQYPIRSWYSKPPSLQYYWVWVHAPWSLSKTFLLIQNTFRNKYPIQEARRIVPWEFFQQLMVILQITLEDSREQIFPRHKIWRRRVGRQVMTMSAKLRRPSASKRAMGGLALFALRIETQPCSLLGDLSLDVWHAPAAQRHHACIPSSCKPSARKSVCNVTLTNHCCQIIEILLVRFAWDQFKLHGS